MGHCNHARDYDPAYLDVATDFDDSDAEDTLSVDNPFAALDPDPPLHQHTNNWESGIRIDVPEFNGTLDPSDFIDWLNTVEEIMNFKRIPDDRSVGLIAKRFKGRASAWWEQLKLTRACTGKPKLTTWAKLRKHLRREFLPFNYKEAHQHVILLEKQQAHCASSFYQNRLTANPATNIVSPGASRPSPVIGQQRGRTAAARSRDSYA